jgi:hypothetical protein
VARIRVFGEPCRGCGTDWQSLLWSKPAEDVDPVNRDAAVAFVAGGDPTVRRESSGLVLVEDLIDRQRLFIDARAVGGQELVQ